MAEAAPVVPADPAAPVVAADPAAAPVVADPAAPVVAADPAAPAADPAAAPVVAELTDFTLPEGMAMDTELAGELKAYAKENGLTQEKAQQVADLGVKMLQKQQDAFVQLQAEWATQAKADKELGGEAFAANLAVSNTGMKQFATPEFIAFLQQTGLGNHPEMIRAFHRVGKAISEDRLVTGGAPSGADVPIEKRMFPDMK
jgi:hypothetical protein